MAWEKKCGHCKGRGTIPVTGEYSDTLYLLRKVFRSYDEITGAELADIAGIKPTAMNNRLAILEKFGFLRSRIWGRKRFYRIK